MRLKNLLVIAAAALAACGAQPVKKNLSSKSTALTSCESDRVIPPKEDGAARTGANPQPVLIVGCGLN